MVVSVVYNWDGVLTWFVLWVAKSRFLRAARVREYWLVMVNLHHE